VTQFRLTLAAAAVALLLGACTRTEPARQEAQRAYRIYVTNETSGDLSIIDSANHELIANIPLGKRPRGIRASHDGRTIYVALSGSPIAGPGVDESKLPPPDRSADGIGVFDVAQNKLVRVIRSGSDPESFDLSRDGKLLYVSNEDAAGVSIVDIEAGKVLQTLPTGEEPEGVTTRPDGAFVYVTSEDDGTVAVVDTNAGKVVKTIKAGRRPRSIVFLPDGSRAYGTAENDGLLSILDARKHEVTGQIQLGEAGVIKPMGLALSPDARTLYVSTGRGRRLFMVNTANNEVIGSVEVGTRPWGVAVSPDGDTIYTANGPSNDLTVVEASARSVTRKVSLPGSPWGVITLSR
jgi:YVTN family beta-propeller protein